MRSLAINSTTAVVLSAAGTCLGLATVVCSVARTLAGCLPAVIFATGVCVDYPS